MNHKEAVAVLNSVLDFYPESIQDGDLPSVIIHDGEQYRIAISLAIHPRSDQHRVAVLELLFDPMPFFRLTRKTKKVIKKLSGVTSKESSIQITVGEDPQGSLECLVSKVYWSPVDAEQIHLDNGKMSALAMVVFQAISDSQ
jgi:hypothetical protein